MRACIISHVVSPSVGERPFVNSCIRVNEAKSQGAMTVAGSRDVDVDVGPRSSPTLAARLNAGHRVNQWRSNGVSERATRALWDRSGERRTPTRAHTPVS